MGNDAGTGLRRRCSELDHCHWLRRRRRRPHKHRTLGILAFETGKAMSRLVSLHKSLTDAQVSRLRNDSVASEGVAYLISADHRFLLDLACREKMEDLDRIALSVARLGNHCSHPVLTQFGQFYDQLKHGPGFTHAHVPKVDPPKIVRKLEKLVATTAELHAGLQSLAEMEISERRMKKWSLEGSTCRANFDLFHQKLSWQRQRVRHLRRVSLWDQTYDKTVALMAPAVCLVYARILVVFASHRQYHQVITKLPVGSWSVNLQSRPAEVSKYCNAAKPKPMINVESTKLISQLPPSTVGGSGLPLGYANVVIMAERCLMSNCASIDKREREGMYQMLPQSLKRLVRSKLKEMMRRGRDEEGWVEGARAILRWLGPMAHDTITWQMERNVEKQTFDVKPRVLLLQTLFLADRDKADDAIAELLGALSCICKYQQLHSMDGGLRRPININFS